ncbi:MAG: hypothetical protein IKV94_01405 [Clostridia bacterium]|nr:hypothetical protein [Clostridia bacterium]
MQLYQLINDLERGLNRLRTMGYTYPNSRAFKEFLDRKEEDFKEFQKLVGPYRRDEFLPNVIRDLKERGVAYKFFGMTQRGADYFKITKKLEKEIASGR